jgi:hypothetical protein
MDSIIFMTTGLIPKITLLKRLFLLVGGRGMIIEFLRTILYFKNTLTLLAERRRGESILLNGYIIIK